MDFCLAARTILQNVQQELATKEVVQCVRSELDNIELREKLDNLSKATNEGDNLEPKNQGLKLNVISGKTFDKISGGGEGRVK